MLDLGENTSGLEHRDGPCGLRNCERDGARRARDGRGGRVARAEPGWKVEWLTRLRLQLNSCREHDTVAANDECSINGRKLLNGLL